MSKILNLTQQDATPEQVAAGVVDPSPELKEKIRRALTFDYLPTGEELVHRAGALARMAAEGCKRIGCRKVMIGGAPYFMNPLVEALYDWHLLPLFAFSRRVVEETRNDDGSVEKRSVFRHEGFVQAI